MMEKDEKIYESMWEIGRSYGKYPTRAIKEVVK